MMTMFSAMRKSLQRWRIIWLLAAALALGACSSLRLGYNQGPELMDWWLDGYVDFTEEQSPRVREALRDWFGWHRSTQLPVYASLLVRLQGQFQQPIDVDAACALQREAVALLDASLDRALPAAAVFAMELNAGQLRHLEKRFDKGNKEFQEEFLQPDPQERKRATVERTLERSERLYGRLNEAQIAFLNEGLAASPFNPELWRDERIARQQELLRLLRNASASDGAAAAPEARARMQAALRKLADEVLESPRPEYRVYQRKLNDYNCRFFSQLHALTNPVQRQKARDTLKGWEDDVRALAAAQ
jgi:Family of unknown function (DUF6279)